MLRVMNVVGARPQFIKAGPVSRALGEAGIEEVLVHTGQHYDDLMSDAIMRDVGLRKPDFNLKIGSGSHATQTARMLVGIESLILDSHVNAVLTYGDTNSTIAAALAASKLNVPTAHVEAGLRSFNRRMPEELNRVVTDHLSGILFAPTTTAMNNLANEGLAERAILTGDVMVDALLSIDLGKVDLPPWALGDFFLATIHRPSNTDEPERLSAILEALGSLPHPTHVMAHPRLRDRLEGTSLLPGRVMVHDPLPYSVMLATLSACNGLITDSGGLQKEAFLLGTICTTIRDETEWTETLVGGWNALAGSALDQLRELVARDTEGMRPDPFGDGMAAPRIVSELRSYLAS